MFFHQITFEMEQEYREQIFAVTKQTLIDVAARSDENNMLLVYL